MKISRIWLWTLLSFICIAILLWIISSLLSSKLEQQIPKYEFGSFKAKVRDVNINLLTGNVVIRDAQLYDTLGSGIIHFPEIKIRRIHILKLLINRKIALSKILINEASLNLYLDVDNKLSLPKKSNISSKLNLEDIGRLQISKTKLIISKQDSMKIDSVYNTQLNLDLWGFSSNNLKKYSYKSTSFDSISFYLQNGSYMFPNELYSINYKTIEYSTHNNNLNIDLLLLKSKYPKYEIGKHTGTETDWFDLSIQDIMLENIRLNSLITDTALISSLLRIKYFALLAFKDKRLPFPQKPDTKLPMEFFNSLPIAFHIDSVKIDDANIEYSERVQNSKEAGVVTFNNLTSTIKNLSNIDSLITAPTTMDARAKVMNKAILTAHFVMPNSKYHNPYTASGQMGPMSITYFNPILKHNASILVKSGEIKHLTFNFQYNNEQSKGNLRFEYEHLKIAILDQSSYKVKTTKSFLINNILLRNKNLAEKESFRIGDISFERYKKRSIFNYWWKSLLSGIKNTTIL